MSILVAILLFSFSTVLAFADNSIETVPPGYNAETRPTDKSMNVTVKLTIQSVFIGEDLQLRTARIQFDQSWLDGRLSGSGNGSKPVKMAAKDIWRPDWMQHLTTAKDSENVEVASNGLVKWSAIRTVESDSFDCDEIHNLDRFPFEKALCRFSVKNSNTDLQIDLSAEVTPHFQAMAAMDSSEVEQTSDKQPKITISFLVGRGTECFKEFFVMPLAILATFAPVPFFMETDSIYKVPFASAIFLAFFLYAIPFYHAVSTIVLISGVMPSMVKCYRLNMVQAGVAILQSAFNVDMCRRPGEPPKLMKKIVGALAKVFLCKCFDKMKRNKKNKATEAASSGEGDEEGVAFELNGGEKRADEANDAEDKDEVTWLLCAAVSDRIFGILFMIHAIVTVIWYVPIFD